ncbi:hypothetical protein TRFO_39738 [Tritrichomonas foetus]|uniref:Uncharacterized protein n=1 Tax=Tritrichomonas foetus TaxID=1144522 RepID=A0A1J4J7B0_9EUKA|nr:hypothetical protein TRFO_39738 [Tritrichomonas foetus]|eukprot:OHS94071.1 hypothetical protein TRFO_39738 [Tritrichomonas foetus]
MMAEIKFRNFRRMTKYKFKFFPKNKMTEIDIAKLMETPADKLNAHESLQLLQHVLHNKDLLKSDHLDIALRHRHFKRAIELINAGVTSPNMIDLISSLLESPVSLDTDFHFFLLFCVISGIDCHEILSHISSFCDENIESAMILIIPILYSNTNIDEIPNSKHPFDSVISAYKSGECAPYSFIKSVFEESIEKFKGSSLLRFSETSSTFKSTEIINRIKELSNALTVTVKGLSNTTQQTHLDQFKNKFNINISDLEKFLTENLLKATRALRSAVAQTNMILYQVDSLQSEVSFCLENFVNKIIVDSENSELSEKIQNSINEIRNICLKFATEIDAKFDFTTSAHSLLFLSTISAILVSYSQNGDFEKFNKSIKKLKEILENISEKLKTDVSDFTLLSEVLSLNKEINNKNNEMYQTVHYASDKLLLSLHFCECLNLEAIIKEEATLYAENATFYPKAYRTVFTKMIKPATKTNISVVRQQRDSLYQEILNRIATFINKLKLIPGMRNDTRYTDFTPTEKWTWPKIPNISFPGTPEEVRKVLLLRAEIYNLAEEYEVSLSTAMCITCKKAIASIVCPKCKKLVLCYSCKEKSHKCPVENCDVTFN